MIEKMTDICKCECHVKGQIILHIIACCDKCGKSYINIDGSIDMDEYERTIYTMTKKELKTCSKYLSLILRHQPEDAGITLDGHGYVNVNELLKALKRKPHLKLTFEKLKEVVETNDKQRFEFNETRTKIRACQGHSVDVDLHYKPVEPPKVLYHGTVGKYIDPIFRVGITKMKRTYVHLSADSDTAIKVGMRKGKPIVLEINAELMHAKGHKFYKSTNGVWLTDHVPTKYIKLTNKTEGRL